jgi:hypothetical protein
MSKMPSNRLYLSKAKALSAKVPLALLALTAVAFVGCSRVDVHADTVRGMAYIRIDDVIKAHPLYGQLAQINDAIAAIDLEASVPRAPLSPQEIAQQTLELNKELKDAQDRANQIIAAKQKQYADQERQADEAALKAAGIDPKAAGIGAEIDQTSQAQAQQAAQAAASSYQSYQQSVIAQSNASANAVAQQLGKQADQKLRARADQYQQEETDLSLRVAQTDATQRMALKTKLNTLALDADTRKSINQQLADLDKKEATQVGAMRSQHAKDMATYSAQLRTEMGSEISHQVASIRSQTNAQLSSRQAAVGSQIRGLGGAPVPSVRIPPDIQKKLAAIHQEMGSKFQADAAASVAEYNQVKSDLDAEFAALHGQNVGAIGAAAKQLRDLRKRRDDLQTQIQSQIQREANRIAKEMGFSVVFDNVHAAAGGYDLTNDLIHDVESLHE